MATIDTPIKIGTEFLVNTYTSSDQYNRAIAALSDGGFLVTWQSYGQDSNDYGVYAQKYDKDSVKVGKEFLVNTYTSSYQGESAIASLSDGGFLVTWTSLGQDGNGYGVYAQRYDKSSVKVGKEFLVNTYTSNSQYNGGIASLSDGGFLVTWTSNGQDGSSYGVYAQRYDKSSVKVGKEFVVNTYTTDYQGESAITALSDGGFLVTWTSDGQDGSSYGVYAQRYNKSSVKVGTEFRVNTYTSSGQSEPAITALSDGGFLVTWTSNGQDGSGYEVYGQRYDKNNNPLGTEFRVNTTTTNNQLSSVVTALANGDFVVSWTSTGQDGSGDGVYAQKFTIGSLVSVASSENNPSVEGVDTVSEFVINLSKPSDKVITVTYTTQDGTAKAGQDYQTTSGTITFQPGETSKIINVPLIDNNLSETDESFTLKITKVDNAYPSSSDMATATITDTIQANFPLTIPTNIENLVLTEKANLTAHGNDSDNKITGNRGNNLLSGGLGNDTLDGGLGNDSIIDTGNINFTLTDTKLTGNGTDTLISIENITLIGGDGNNTLNASTYTKGGVTLDGKLGNDTLTGGSKNDTLIGGLGNDSLIGGLGSDTVIDSGNANFTVTNTTLTGLSTDTLNGIERVILTAGDGNNTLNGSTFTGSIVYDGGLGNDTLTGGTTNDTLNGGSGVDTLIESGNKNFTLTNIQLIGNGTDTLSAIEQAKLTGGASNNTLNATTFNLGNVTLDGGAGNDTVTGGTKNDLLTGGSGNDSLVGGLGNDSLTGVGSENGTNSVDTLTGGAGNDLFILGHKNTPYYQGNLANDYANITDFNSTQDKIQLAGTADNYISFAFPGVSNFIYRDVDGNKFLGNNDDLVATLPNVTGSLDLTASYFSYV